jgi:hypothetical protein
MTVNQTYTVFFAVPEIFGRFLTQRADSAPRGEDFYEEIDICSRTRPKLLDEAHPSAREKENLRAQYRKE